MVTFGTHSLVYVWFNEFIELVFAGFTPEIVKDKFTHAHLLCKCIA
jgi:hypothetical protein